LYNGDWLYTADTSTAKQNKVRLTERIKEIMARRAAVIVPGAANAMFARVIEATGYEAVYVTGAGIANMHLGVPDIGLTTMTEVAETVARISDAVSIPVIADADTGFGSAVNVVRTVRTFERAGAAAIQIEDQKFPKKCGHFAGKEILPLQDMLAKIKAAVDSRHDSALQIIARTDARAVEGIDHAIERALAFTEAGADVTFVEAPGNLKELSRIPQDIRVPQVANIVFGGKTPDPGCARLQEYGYSIVLYANAVLQAALKASYDMLTALKKDGSLVSVADYFASFQERQKLVGKDTWDELERRYRVE
jgi:2-methylisocitrate lyase-like PEP mutase family enzyme